VIAFLVIVYTAIVIVLFKMKILAPRPFPIAWVAVAGVFIIGAVVVGWTLCSPMSKRVVTTQYVVQLVSYVKGQVKKIHARANEPVKKGDLLLEINPVPYQYTVNQLEAQLAAARDNVKQSRAGEEAAAANVVKAGASIKQAQAGVTQSKAALANAQAGLTKARAALANAQAGVVKARASDDLARTDEQIALKLRKMDAGAISELKVTEAVQNRKAADAALKQAQTGADEAQAGVQQAEAGVNQARAAVLQSEAGLGEAQAGQQQAEAADRQARFALQMAQSNVPAVQAQLDEARFNLAQCRMLAPDDGYVVNWQVQEGTMIMTIPLAAAGTFICTSQTFIAASFPQNYLMHVQPGNEVELVLDPYPGRLFKARVDTVITATGEGQFAPSGTIPDASRVGSQGLLAVKIQLTGDDPSGNLPLGAGGSVAIYTDHGKPVHIISKVTIRMKKWLLFVLPS
jgi:multidrug resistance efflux pump